ncbi:hypothetical protein PX699_17380 [Sphingobium sp. H39-3-25]|uniref:hypothetical protein n=1 Tax=Sphingobium arseniciresistens TaxID=3030834 RepID=UPI0023B94129|nr:hypothetical protein [Sphingobium arseniciresistens]
MIGHAKNILPLVGGSLLLGLALAGCDRKSDQTVPPAANSVAAVSVTADTANGGYAESTDAMGNQEAMERHHRQAIDHEAMRSGGMNQTAPATDAAPANSAMPMKDM